MVHPIEGDMAYRRSPRPLLKTAILGAAISILLLAIIMPLWLPRAVRMVIPDRYLVAYAPEFVKDIVFNESAGEALPTLAPLELQAQEDLMAQLERLAQSTPSPLPTLQNTGGLATPEAGPPSTLTPAVLAENATAAPTAVPPIPSYVLLTGFTYEAQGWNNCGPATLAMMLSHWSLTDDQFSVVAKIKPHPEDSNVRPDELVYYIKSRGLGAISRINGSLDTMKRLIAAGYPVMIERGFPAGELEGEDWMGHFMLLIGYSEESQEFYTLDSFWGWRHAREDRGFPVDYWDSARLDDTWRHFNRVYVVAFPPTDYDRVAEIIGEDMDDQVMYAKALQNAYAETRAYDDTFAYYNLGSVLALTGDYSNAATAFDLARERVLPWRMYWYQFDLYEAYYQAGRYEDVLTLAQYTADITNYPESEEAYYYIGRVYAARGQIAAARSAFNRALSYNTTFQRARDALAALDAQG
mgnify:CR=1 FL=1